MNDSEGSIYTSTRPVNKNIKFVTKEKIIMTVTKEYNISFELLETKSRKSEIVYPRQLIMYLLIKYTQLSYRSIGDMFGHRDHTTVISAKKKIKDLLDTYENVRYELEEIIQKLYA